MNWLSTTTPTSGLCSRSHEAAWIPSSVPVGGIRMSVTTTAGEVVLDQLQEFGQIGGPAHEVEIRFAVDDPCDPLPQECIVLRQNHPDARHAMRTVARLCCMTRVSVVLPPREQVAVAPLGEGVSSRRLQDNDAGRRGRIGAVIEQRLDLARYRTRSTFRRSRGGYLALIILLGLVGGLGLGSLSAARRTQSSFTDLLATTQPFGPAGVDLLGRIHESRLSGIAYSGDSPVARGQTRRRRLHRGRCPAHSRRHPEDPGDGTGVPGGQCQRALLHPGPHDRERGATGVPATS